MDHQEASSTQAVERYLLDELTPDEREQFEEHFFSCSDCAEAVRTGAILTLNGRELVQEQSRRPPVPGQAVDITATRPGKAARQHWIRSMAAVSSIAAAILLCLVTYQNLVTIPGLKQHSGEWGDARALMPVVLRAQSRGARPTIRANARSPVVLNLEMNGARLLPLYQVDLLDAKGATLFTIRDAPAREGTVEIALPGAKLAPGVYEMLVREPQGGAEAGRFPFQLEK